MKNFLGSMYVQAMIVELLTESKDFALTSVNFLLVKINNEVYTST